MGAGDFKKIQCKKGRYNMGRFVAIYFGHPGTLTVCEFEVYGGRFPCGLL